MNKTVNINLAGLFFHIDENAYAKLQRYLDAIKKSFTDSQGRDEIIQDIEARIAELFSERVKNERQVIGLKEVDEVIEIMGQPEDYRLDEEIFEDESPKTAPLQAAKKLYRDSDNSYVAGVCSGLGYYLGIDAIWLRILFIALTFFTGGGFILVYVVFWIFVPQAITTSEKLEMRGKPVNIDNIQRKVKEGFENVADTVKNVDYEKYGNRARKGAGGFFATIGSIFMFVLKVIAKLIGIALIIGGAVMVIALFVGLFTAGTMGFVDGTFVDYVDLVNTTEAPIWVISLLVFFAAGIPFFAMFYLGLKILVNNLRSMSLTAKLTLLGIWLLSIIALSVLGIRQATAFSVDSEVSSTVVLNMQPSDTLKITMASSNRRGLYRSDNWRIDYENGEQVIRNQDIRLVVKESEDGKPALEVVKSAQGRNYQDAHDRAENIDYGYTFNNNTLTLNGYFTTALKNKHRDQEVQVIVYLPEGAHLIAAQNTSSFHRNDSRYGDLLESGTEEKLLILEQGELTCETCPDDHDQIDEGDWQYHDYEEGDDAPYEYDEAATRKKDAVDLKNDIPTDTINKQLDTINR